MIKYYKLFDLLNRRGMKKSDLLAMTSSKTIAKLSKGENINTNIIDKICDFLNCQPGDIMEYTIMATDTINKRDVEISIIRDDEGEVVDIIEHEEEQY